jgi:Flp pilus assembly protein TadD
MSRTLNLVDGLLLSCRNHQQFGRHRDALTALTQLAGLRELPCDVAEEVQARLGEIQLGRKKFRRAGRHLTLALRYDPDNPHYHTLLASALHKQGEEQWERAAEHYRRAVALDPKNVECLTEFGLLLVRMGQTDEGLTKLREACDLAPDCPKTLTKLAKGLRLAGRPDDARSELRAAMFRHPRDLRFRQLWQDAQFQELAREQRRARIQKRNADNDEPVILPFVPSERVTGLRGRAKILRHDPPTPRPSPRGSGQVRHVR